MWQKCSDNCEVGALHYFPHQNMQQTSPFSRGLSKFSIFTHDCVFFLFYGNANDAAAAEHK